MKEGSSLPVLARELYRQANSKRDLLVPASNLTVQSNGHTDLIAGETYAVNDIAHSQLAEYLGIPKPYYDRMRCATENVRVPVFDEKCGCPSDNPLFDVSVNALLRAKGDDCRLVRTLDNKARAFLSDSYSVDLDNFDVFQVAAKVIEEQGLGPENVVSAEITERKLYVKVISPKLQATIQPDNVRSGGMLKEPQVIQAGFILTNSEVGLGSLSVQQTVMKLMCTNLWIKEDAYKQRHIGKTLESDDVGTIYRSDTRIADAKARLLKIRDHVESALNEHQFLALAQKMQETAHIRLEGSIEKVVDNSAKRFGLIQSEKEDVLRNLIEGADLTAWGLTNAITQTAQGVKSYDRATELEAIGGKFFTMPSSELREIVTAN
ncbi:MAG: DUF932 domain-containing protein [Chthonomonadales bacterium]